MHTIHLSEPELEFGLAKHIDIKFGLMNYGPLDFNQPLAPKKIKLGIIGTAESIEGITRWLEKCSIGIDAKTSKRPNLFPRFPGFGEARELCAEFISDSSLQRAISPRYFEVLCRGSRSNLITKQIAQLFLDEIEYLSNKTTVDIFVCAFPFMLVEYLEQESESFINDESEEYGSKSETNIILHDYLKAETMQYKKPIQIIRPSTYDESKKIKQNKGKVRQLQDEATRAWNLYVALYYKAGGIPWRLSRNSSQLSTCYVGVSFYNSLDQESLLTSTAQVFNERGEGIILRGGNACLSKSDKQIHLTSEDAYNLLINVLEIYKREHKNFPARVVVHKSSIHNNDEIEGFEEALRKYFIDPGQADFLSITHSRTRLFRANRYPPLRGTLFNTGGDTFILYTKGSIDFFTTYPGLYVPNPLGFRCDSTSETATFLAQEILALTKMNWNNTQFDGSDPITLRTARQVGRILKYIDVSKSYEPYYRYYM